MSALILESGEVVTVEAPVHRDGIKTLLGAEHLAFYTRDRDKSRWYFDGDLWVNRSSTPTNKKAERLFGVPDFFGPSGMFLPGKVLVVSEAESLLAVPLTGA